MVDSPSVGSHMKKRIRNRIHVSIRLRPFIAEDKLISRKANSNPEACIHLKSDGQTIKLFKDPYNAKYFRVDRTFDPQANQETVYEATFHHLVLDLVDGFNATGLAYGQTGSGKTYTLFGTETSYGLTHLVIRDLFDIIRKREERDLVSSVFMSFYQVYLEQSFDLLVDPEIIQDKAYTPLVMREDVNKGTYLENLQLMFVEDQLTAEELLEHGLSNRRVTSTNYNMQSSRSHAILQLHLEFEEPVPPSDERHVLSLQSFISSGFERQPQESDAYRVRRSVLTLVDLAGSERIQSYQVTSKEQFKEAVQINKSISALGNCIQALAKNSTSEKKGVRRKSNGFQQHIPYRDCKLTRLLAEPLGGNAKTYIIATVGPCLSHYEDTHSTLKFASRAMTVKKAVRREITKKIPYHLQETESSQAKVKHEGSGNSSNGMKPSPTLEFRLVSSGNHEPPADDNGSTISSALSSVSNISRNFLQGIRSKTVPNSSTQEEQSYISDQQDGVTSSDTTEVGSMRINLKDFLKSCQQQIEAKNNGDVGAGSGTDASLSPKMSSLIEGIIKRNQVPTGQTSFATQDDRDFSCSEDLPTMTSYINDSFMEEDSQFAHDFPEPEEWCGSEYEQPQDTPVPSQNSRLRETPRQRLSSPLAIDTTVSEQGEFANTATEERVSRLSDMPKSVNLRIETKSPTLRSVTPQGFSPRVASSRSTSPRQNSSRQSSPRAGSPKIKTPRSAPPRMTRVEEGSEFHINTPRRPPPRKPQSRDGSPRGQLSKSEGKPRVSNNKQQRSDRPAMERQNSRRDFEPPPLVRMSSFRSQTSEVTDSPAEEVMVDNLDHLFESKEPSKDKKHPQQSQPQSPGKRLQLSRVPSAKSQKDRTFLSLLDTLDEDKELHLNASFTQYYFKDTTPLALMANNRSTSPSPRAGAPTPIALSSHYGAAGGPYGVYGPVGTWVDSPIANDTRQPESRWGDSSGPNGSPGRSSQSPSPRKVPFFSSRDNRQDDASPPPMRRVPSKRMNDSSDPIDERPAPMPNQSSMKHVMSVAEGLRVFQGGKANTVKPNFEISKKGSTPPPRTMSVAAGLKAFQGENVVKKSVHSSQPSKAVEALRSRPTVTVKEEPSIIPPPPPGFNHEAWFAPSASPKHVISVAEGRKVFGKSALTLNEGMNSRTMSVAAGLRAFNSNSQNNEGSKSVPKNDRIPANRFGSMPNVSTRDIAEQYPLHRIDTIDSDDENFSPVLSRVGSTGSLFQSPQPTNTSQQSTPSPLKRMPSLTRKPSNLDQAARALEEMRRMDRPKPVSSATAEALAAIQERQQQREKQRSLERKSSERTVQRMNSTEEMLKRGISLKGSSFRLSLEESSPVDSPMSLSPPRSQAYAVAEKPSGATRPTSQYVSKELGSSENKNSSQGNVNGGGTSIGENEEVKRLKEELARREKEIGGLREYIMEEAFHG